MPQSKKKKIAGTAKQVIEESGGSCSEAGKDEKILCLPG
jgi:hypothetical protein